MNYIRRWDVETMDERTSSDGKWVLHSDHEAEVARLRAEVEKNRVDAERYRWIRDVLRHNASRWQAVVDYNQSNVTSEEFGEAIDAAMGEGK